MIEPRFWGGREKFIVTMINPMRQRLSTLLTYLTLSLLIALRFAGSSLSAAPLVDNCSDTWVATDALGREFYELSRSARATSRSHGGDFLLPLARRARSGGTI